MRKQHGRRTKPAAERMLIRAITISPAADEWSRQQADRFHGGNRSRYFQTLADRDEASGGRLGMPAALLDVTETAA